MPRITVNNVDSLNRDIQLQDPAGIAGSSATSVFSVNIPAGQTRVYDVPTALAEALLPLLDGLVSLSRATYTVTRTPSSPVEAGSAADLVYTMATRPAANSVPPGTSIIVSDAGPHGETQRSNGTAWINSAGVLS